MSARLKNWRLWAGFGVALLALVGYLLAFSTTRDAFWPCLFLFVVGAWLMIAGLRRAFGQPQVYRGKIAGSVLATLTLALAAVFSFASYEVFKHFPAARNAPKVGQRAPQFTLVDSTGANVSLSGLLTTSVKASSGVARVPKGVLVVFYRGYW